MKRIHTCLLVCLVLSITANAQNIQNTFFDMRLGSILSVQTIKNNVGDRGVYDQYENRGSVQRVIFENVSFGADIWMWGEFELTRDDHFFEFSVRNAYSNKAEAERCFSKMRDRLNEKYSAGTESNEDESTSVYYGGASSSSLLCLGLNYSKSVTGTWLYYVELSYWSVYWLDKMIQDSESEL